MADKKQEVPVVLVTITSGQTIVCRARAITGGESKSVKSIDLNATHYKLANPAFIAQAGDGGLGLEAWPMFSTEDLEEVVVKTQDVICIVEAHSSLSKGYKAFADEETVITPKKPGLILPK